MMTDIFHQEAFVESGKDTSKLRTNDNIQTDISRISISNQDLMIEM